MTATAMATILGCGSSAGVPRVAAGWGACDPQNPRNRRRRCSLLVERFDSPGKFCNDAKSDGGIATLQNERPATRILVDTSPDLREQLLGVNVTWLDAVLYTHDHADHTHGIDDLRPVAIHNHRRVDVYMEAATQERMARHFSYCFATAPGSPYPPILNAHTLEPTMPVTIEGTGGPVVVQPYPQIHGPMMSLGFRFGDFAYSCDLSDLPEESVALLQGLDVLVIDALRYTTHISHLNVDQALEWIERLRPRRAILTNLHVDLDYETLRARLPSHVEPAYDRMQIPIVGRLA